MLVAEDREGGIGREREGGSPYVKGNVMRLLSTRALWLAGWLGY